MELELGHPICSLCRQALSNSSFKTGSEAKLCNGCRDLIETALHGNRTRAVAASTSLQQSQAVVYAQSGALTVSNLEAQPSAFFNELPALSDTSPLPKQTRFFNLNDGSFGSQFDDEPSELPESDHRSGGLEVEPAELQEAQREIAIVEAEPFAYETQFPNGPEPAVQPAQDSLAGSMIESAEHHEVAFVEITDTIEPPSANLGDDPSRLDQSSADTQNDNDLSFSTPPLAAPSEQYTGEPDAHPVAGVPSTPDAVPVDPWEQTLPDWDHSRHEYPVLMGPPQKGSFSKYEMPVVVILILALAAGLYFLIYPQLSRQRASEPVNVPSPPTAAARAETQRPDPVAQSPTASTSSDTPVRQASTETKSAQQANPEEPVANAPTNAQGRFALQAASFPTQAGADEFAERLKTAGVPSYVVAADLSHRGKWFRVRVGRFNTAAEAQRFAAEAQLRAKAAGVPLQLVVSQYD